MSGVARVRSVGAKRRFYVVITILVSDETFEYVAAQYYSLAEPQHKTSGKGRSLIIVWVKVDMFYNRPEKTLNGYTVQNSGSEKSVELLR
jgi:hypothetical protein